MEPGHAGTVEGLAEGNRLTHALTLGRPRAVAREVTNGIHGLFIGLLRSSSAGHLEGRLSASPAEFTWTDPNGILLSDHHDPPPPRAT